ncbi:MAG: PIN domain-containing protein [Acidobacteriota bacterium]|nr:PIN domain-containing protein [Acidobacteriota bacterium]
MESADPDTLFTSVLSFGEIRKGIELLPPGKKRDELEQWIASDLNRWFGNNLLPVSQAISNRWGILDAQSHQQGRPLGNIDGLLAATAFEHGLTVATRNTKAFRGFRRNPLRPLERLGQIDQEGRLKRLRLVGTF